MSLSEIENFSLRDKQCLCPRQRASISRRKMCDSQRRIPSHHSPNGERKTFLKRWSENQGGTRPRQVARPPARLSARPCSSASFRPLVRPVVRPPTVRPPMRLFGRPSVRPPVQQRARSPVRAPFEFEATPGGFIGSSRLSQNTNASRCCMDNSFLDSLLLCSGHEFQRSPDV